MTLEVKQTLLWFYFYGSIKAEVGMSKTVKLSRKRQIAIPRAICDHLKIRTGQQLIISETHGQIVITPKPKSYTDALMGLGQELWKGIDPLDYIRQERASWEKRDSKHA